MAAEREFTKNSVPVLVPTRIADECLAVSLTSEIYRHITQYPGEGGDSHARADEVLKKIAEQVHQEIDHWLQVGTVDEKAVYRDMEKSYFKWIEDSHFKDETELFHFLGQGELELKLVDQEQQKKYVVCIQKKNGQRMLDIGELPYSAEEDQQKAAAILQELEAIGTIMIERRQGHEDNAYLVTFMIEMWRSYLRQKGLKEREARMNEIEPHLHEIYDRLNGNDPSEEDTGSE